MAKTAKPIARGRGIQSISIGCRVLRAIEAAPGHLPLKDIAAAAHMPASKVRFYIVSFLQEGLVIQDPVSGHYALGPFAIRLGLAALRQAELVDLARDAMLALRNETRLSTFLTIWGNRGPTIVSKIEGQEHSPMTIRVGYVLPLSSSATGQVFLAHLPEREIEPILKLEQAGILGGSGRPLAIADVPALAEKIRKRGYGVSTNKLNEGFSGASAPIFDSNGELAGAITLLGSNDAFQTQRLKTLAPILIATAARISSQLGYEEARPARLEPAE